MMRYHIIWNIDERENLLQDNFENGFLKKVTGINTQLYKFKKECKFDYSTKPQISK